MAWNRPQFYVALFAFIARLRARGVHLEQLVFPDEVHDFHSSRLRAFQADSDFFDRQFSWPQK